MKGALPGLLLLFSCSICGGSPGGVSGRNQLWSTAQSTGPAGSAAGAQLTPDAEWQQATTESVTLFRQGKYREALVPARRSVELARQFGPKDPRLITSLTNLANLTYYAGNATEGISLLENAIDTAQKAFGREELQVSEPMQSLAKIYQDQGRLQEAESLLEEVLKIRQGKLPPDHPELARTYNNLGVLYSDEGKFPQAEQMLEKAASAQGKLTGYNRSALAATIANLASAYLREGKIDQTEALYNQALSIDETALGADHPEVATILGNLGELYQEERRFGDAEPLMRRSLDIKMKILPANHPEVAAGLKHLADLYRDEGKDAEAEPIYRQVLAVQKSALGAESLAVANTSLNLAVLYTRQYNISQDKNQFVESEQLLREALDIQNKRLRPGHPEIAITMERLGQLYLEAGNSKAAIPLLQESLTTQKTRVPPDPTEIAQLFWDLGDAALQTRQFEQAEAYFKQQLATENARAPSARSECTWDLAGTYFNWGRPSEAEKCFQSNLEELRKTLDTQFVYMSDAERLGFMDTFRLTLPLYFSFVAKYPTSESAGNMYNVLLWQKGLVAAGISSMRGRIAASGDSGASTLLDQITQRRTEIARLRNAAMNSSSTTGVHDRMAQLEIEANDAERELSRRFPAVAGHNASSALNWQSIQSRLGKDEAAVEYVRYQSYEQGRWTGASRYAALVLTSGRGKSPALIPLGEAAALECGPLDEYREMVGLAPACKPCVGSPTNSLTFYQAFWKPLEGALAGAHRIYLAGDGVLTQTSFAPIQDEAGNLLLKKYDLRPVVSTRDLLRKVQISHPRTAVLIGDPKFNATAEEQRTALLEISRHSSDLHNARSEQLAAKASLAAASQSRSMELGDLQWKPLPDTKVELDGIEKLMGNRWRVGSFEGDEALVEAIKSVRGPQVLHVATHGFFLPDDASAQTACADRARGMTRPVSPSASSVLAPARDPVRDPLLRSGLVFTGANRGTSGPSAPDLSNGVLTAYEAATLDLSGTELVVLSACDTGLGTMFAGEGVLGLRRSFQEAGAESILMSLWAVPSRATEELMKRFYSKWLAGKDKHEALAEAQLELRSRPEFAAPKNWAGFVLVGP
ncbi:MAG TPA: CHAT domain-containing tetratricopeptide repeat protein [Candidatus Sulfotelmatobacter sp.]